MQMTLALAMKTLYSDFAQNLMRDLKSLRALWNWIYMGLYVCVCVWTVLKHPDYIPTVISVTGSVVSIIFTGYVLSKAYEKGRNVTTPNNTPPE
jgi:FtsH-binding integral membrane protein